MRLALVSLLAALLAPAATAAGGRADGRADGRVREALRRGMGYMIESLSDEAHFRQYASDYLFFLADVERIDDPWIAERARSLGQRLGRFYLGHLFRTDTADDVVDAASALWALGRLGLDVEPALAVLQTAAGRFGPAEYWGFAAGEAGLPDVDLLIDLLIGLHFTDRMRIGVGVAYAEALPFVAGVDLRVDPAAEPGRYIDLNNLVTHLVYTLAGYASWNVPGELLARERAYLERHLDFALAWGDPETLAEYIDSLELMGYGPDEPRLAAGIELLLALQKPDGRWEPGDVADEYDRYHATWCAMDALRTYALDGPDRLPDPLSRRVLEAWARGRSGAGEPGPWMPVASPADH